MPMTDEIKQIVRELLKTECSQNEQGLFHSEIYVDYRDEFDKRELLNICKSENPREIFEERMMECYRDAEWDCEEELLKKILQTEEIAAEIEAGKVTEDEITEFVREHHYVNLPYNHFLQQDLCVDILLNAGDLNEDYTLNTAIVGWYGQRVEFIDENSGILWLARRQGYKKSQLNRTLRKREYGDSRFLRSLLAEIENCTTHMNAVTFLVKMTLGEWFKLNDAIQKEKKLNDRYDPRRSKGRGYLLIDRSTTCGLYDPWGGAGGVLEIKLERDVRLPIHFIDSALPDGGRGYSIDEIYGLCSSEWRDNAVKEIHEQKKVA